jgi:hypothetical protein
MEPPREYYAGQKRKYNRIVDAEKDIGGKRITFGKKKGAIQLPQ